MNATVVNILHAERTTPPSTRPATALEKEALRLLRLDRPDGRFQKLYQKPDGTVVATTIDAGGTREEARVRNAQE